MYTCAERANRQTKEQAYVPVCSCAARERERINNDDRFERKRKARPVNHFHPDAFFTMNV